MASAASIVTPFPSYYLQSIDSIYLIYKSKPRSKNIFLICSALISMSSHPALLISRYELISSYWKCSNTSRPLKAFSFWTKHKLNGDIVSNIYRTIWTDAEIWHTDELTISPLAKTHPFVFCTLLRGVQPRRSPLLFFVIVCLTSAGFIAFY